MAIKAAARQIAQADHAAARPAERLVARSIDANPNHHQAVGGHAIGPAVKDTAVQIAQTLKTGNDAREARRRDGKNKRPRVSRQ